MTSRDAALPKGPSFRVILTAITLLATIQLALAVFAFLQVARDGDGRFRLPLPNRVAAMVEILEAADPSLRDALELALSAADFEVEIVASLPAGDHRERYPLVRVERAVARYVQAVGTRRVEAWLAPFDEGEPGLRFDATRLYSDAPMRLGVSLAGGEAWLLVTTRERLAQRVFGFPPGLWAGAFGVVVAGLALLALWRGLGPLNRLATSMEDFGREAVPRAVPEAGAREVRQVTRSANAMQTKIAELIAERGVAHAALSHDLRTYLARLALRVDAIPDEPSREKANGEIEEMSRLVEDSLTVLRLDGPLDRSSAETVDLTEVAKEVAERHDMSISFGPGISEPVSVQGSHSLLRRAIENLVVNAERHAGGGKISFERSDRTVVVSVLDRGPGLDPSEIERLLKPFERGDRTRTLDVAGSGLGLAIAERIARAHDGSMSIASRPGGGLVASLRLPMARN